MKKRKGLNIRAAIAFGIVFGIIAWFIIALVVGFLTATADGTPFNAVKALAVGVTDYRVWLLWIAAAVAVCVLEYVRNYYAARRVKKINTTEDQHWLTDAEIRKSDNMQIIPYDKLGEANDGVPIYARRVGNMLTVVLVTPGHVEIVGATRTGKTATFVAPTIQILSSTKTKPSMVITDPKGELYSEHGATLKERGYNVLAIDVINTYASARWNPFNDIIVKTRTIASSRIADDEIRKQLKLVVPKNGKYVFDGKTYDTYSAAEDAMLVYRQIITDEVYADLQDIIYTLCPLTASSNNVSWEQGARDFIFGIALAMWEDLRDGYCDEKSFNLYTLYRNLVEYGSDEDLKVLTPYLCNRGPDSRAKGVASTVLIASGNTRTSYLSEVTRLMSWLADNGVCAMTADNDLDLDAFAERPTALFIKIPDEKENRHKIVTVLISQFYKTLVAKGRKNTELGETKGGRLKRNMYFVCDEFGNLPKLESIGNIATVGAGRGIFFMLILQNYEQLETKYDKVAGTVRANCGTKMFIGTTHEKTLDEWSKMCGKTKEVRTSFNDRTPNTMGVSVAAEAVPLIYPNQLRELNRPPHEMGNTIVICQSSPPLKSKFEPVFKSRELYGLSNDVLVSERPVKPFDTEGHFFDFAVQNALTAAQDEKQEVGAPKEKRTAPPVDEIEEAPLDPFDRYGDFTMKQIDSIKPLVPDELGADLDDAFYSRDIGALLAAAEAALDVAETTGNNFLLGDAAKLKVTVSLNLSNTTKEI